MRYFLDFDRTIFDTPAFKRSVQRHPPLLEVLTQAKDVLIALISPRVNSEPRLRAFRRALGTYASHGRFLFTPHDLKSFLYPEVPAFLDTHECVIVTYGVEMFIRAKVASALTDLKVLDVVYTSRKKGRTIRRLTEDQSAGPFVFIDDAHFQLESVARWCPDVKVIEIRRDNIPSDGRWPVIRSLDELTDTTRGVSLV